LQQQQERDTKVSTVSVCSKRSCL